MGIGIHRARALIGAMIGALFLAGCLSSGPGDQAAGTSISSSTPVVLVIDASGSMTKDDVSGTRMEAAKQAGGDLIDALPPQTPFALLTYGTKSTGKSGADVGCQDVTTLTPLGPVDASAAKRQIEGLKPSGWTPIGPSMKQAADLLPTGDDPAVIVVISDGEDKCSPPPCEVAREIVGERPGVMISTIGFRASDEGLSCIAEATKGVYVTADNTEQLSKRLLAVTAPEAAAAKLSPQGAHGLSLGMSRAEAATAAPDFPSDGESRDEGGKTVVVIQWRDCRWTFTDDQLTSIEPTGGAASTIDEVQVGDPIANADRIYGKALVRTSGDDLTSGQKEYIYPAATSATGDDARNGWRIVTDSADRIITITLCRCYVEPGTEVTVIYPFNADGSLKSNYTVTDWTDHPVMCERPSLTGVSENTYGCGLPSDNTHSCVPDPSNDGTLYCLIDAWSHEIVRVSAANALAGQPLPEQPEPLAIELADGSRRVILAGGARPASPPGTFWAYSCPDCAAGSDEVLGDDNGRVNRNAAQWTVLMGQLGDTAKSLPPPTKTDVAKAWFISSTPDATYPGR